MHSFTNGFMDFVTDLARDPAFHPRLSQVTVCSDMYAASLIPQDVMDTLEKQRGITFVMVAMTEDV